MRATDTAIAYHLATKHHYGRFARSLGYLDWANQPDPFRRFDGAPTYRLPFAAEAGWPAYGALYVPGAIAPARVTRDSVAALFEHSLGLSAWKEYGGSRWSLRCNPSSGNLHPTEGYLVCDGVEGLHDGPAVYHYAPREHALERRAAFGAEVWKDLMRGFPAGSFLVGLTSIHWREAWKYGERAYRYCQHDVGHAMAAVALSAAMQGWGCVHLEGAADAEVSALLGLDRGEDFGEAEREHPDVLLAIVPWSGGLDVPRTLPMEAVRAVAQGEWAGRANRLSAEHVEWDVIDVVADACVKPATEAEPPALPEAPTERVPDGPSARGIIRQRRSAVDMDGRTSIGRETFYGMLRRLVPGLCPAPWYTLAGPAAIHLGLFVHRVDGLMPGMYALVRQPDAAADLRQAMGGEFLWERPASCPANLPLYALRFEDVRGIATQVSCQQDMAGDGAFSVAMLGEFRGRIERHGSWFYRRLFWEAGMVGQVLYLEAEAAGVRGTGIGCYFDDAVHDVFGLEGLEYQSMYHFTVGGPVDDPRLTTRPPYSDARRALAAGLCGNIE